MIISMGRDYGKASCQHYVTDGGRLTFQKLDGAAASPSLDYQQLQLAQKCLNWRNAKIKVQVKKRYPGVIHFS